MLKSGGRWLQCIQLRLLLLLLRLLRLPASFWAHTRHQLLLNKTAAFGVCFCVRVKGVLLCVLSRFA